MSYLKQVRLLGCGTSLKLPSSCANAVAASQQEGHELTSQGCGLFRCVLCNKVQFVDDNHTYMRGPCPKAKFRVR